MSESLNRRDFFKTSTAVAATAAAGLTLDGFIARGAGAAPLVGQGGYGALAPVASNNLPALGSFLTLPAGFQYTLISRNGDPLNDGSGANVPNLFDGMATFASTGKNGKSLIRLVRNHEVRDQSLTNSAFGDLTKAYDANARGGTTTLIVDPVTRLLATAADLNPGENAQYISLSGTLTNCAGGATPWGTWITCEETTNGADRTGSGLYPKNHGYNFEVNVGLNGQTQAVALKAMGRFSHEAIAVDPNTSIVYQTEDAGSNSGFYRYIPDTPGNLAAGGRLQMLRHSFVNNFDSRNSVGTATPFRIGQTLLCTWVDVPNPDPTTHNSTTSPYAQGFARGGMRFNRLEGAWFGSGSIFFDSTQGGRAGVGQVFRYTPFGKDKGYLTLIYESPGSNVLDAPDNLCVSPRGGIVLCEDGGGDQFVRCLTRSGFLFDFAKNNAGDSEFCGATFSPDGQTLFLNVQGGGTVGSGRTFAIWGPWENGAL